MSSIIAIRNLDEFVRRPTIEKKPERTSCCAKIHSILKRAFSSCCQSSKKNEVTPFDRSNGECPFEPSSEARFDSRVIYEERSYEYSIDVRWEAAGEDTTS